jgi:DNA-binding response OmpR family regulator
MPLPWFWMGDSMRKPRIIIFDDDKIILELLHNYFSACNFEVQSFNAPILCRHAKDMGRCQKPCADIIITDYVMPGINGIELLDSHFKHGCAIESKNKAIVSGDLPDRYRDKMNGLADAFFRKPVRLRELYEWTKACIDRIDLSQPLRNYTTF